MSAPPTDRKAVLRVMLVDDHDLIRQGLARAFERTSDCEVSGQADSVASAQELARTLLPDVVVTDVRLPDGSGLDLVRALRDQRPEIGLVVLTMYAGDTQMFEALKAGASAFVPKDVPADEVVLAARRSATAPRSFAAQGLTEAMQRKLSTPKPALSPREREVLQLLADGVGVAEVARRLYVSESTAKTHVSSIYEKLGATNRAQAVMKAVRAGLLAHT